MDLRGHYDALAPLKTLVGALAPFNKSVLFVSSCDLLIDQGVATGEDVTGVVELLTAL